MDGSSTTVVLAIAVGIYFPVDSAAEKQSARHSNNHHLET